MPIGQKLLQAGLIDQTRISQILQEQIHSGLRFGEICIREQILPIDQVYRFVECQTLGIGEILVIYDFVSMAQIEEGLKLQRHLGKKLGEALISKGWATPEILNWCLHEQARLQQLGQTRAWDVLQSRISKTITVRQQLKAALSDPMAPPTDIDLEAATPVQPLSPSTQIDPFIGVPLIQQTPQHSRARPSVDQTGIVNLSEVSWLDDTNDAYSASSASEKAFLIGKIESLELQLQQREADINDYYHEVEVQINQYKTQFETRVQFLEQQLKQKIEELERQTRNANEAENRISELEAQLWRQTEQMKTQEQKTYLELQDRILDLETELRAANRVERKYEELILKQQEKIQEAQTQLKAQETELEHLQQQVQDSTAQNVVPIRSRASSIDIGSKYTISPSASYQLQQLLRRYEDLMIPLAIMNVREHFDIGEILSNLYPTDREVEKQANRLESLLQVHRREYKQNSADCQQIELQIFRLLGLHSPTFRIEQTN